jgi:hypothetical protein
VRCRLGSVASGDGRTGTARSYTWRLTGRRAGLAQAALNASDIGGQRYRTSFAVIAFGTPVP